jgi:hypothetical protein
VVRQYLKKSLWSLIVVFLVAALLLCLCESGSAADPADMRWEVLSQCHISTAGSDQSPAAAVDTIMYRGFKQVSADFPTTENDTTINLSHGIFKYALPSDFLSLPDKGTILWCLIFRNAPSDTVTYPLPTLPNKIVYPVTMGGDNAVLPASGRAPGYVWVSNDSLCVWPIAVGGDDSLMVGYRAYATSIGDIATGYREHLVKWSCAHVLWKVGRYAEGDKYMEWYEAQKAQNAQ